MLLVLMGLWGGAGIGGGLLLLLLLLLWEGCRGKSGGVPLPPPMEWVFFIAGSFLPACL